MNNENQTIHKSDDNLTIYGWNEKLNQLKQESIYSTLAHGRVSIVHRTCYEVISGNGLFQCELTGNMMYGNRMMNYLVQVIGSFFNRSMNIKGL